MAISLSNNNNVTDSYNKESYAKIPQVLKVPHLIQSQLDTYDWFQTDGLQDVFQEVNPIIARMQIKRNKLHSSLIREH